MRSPTCLLLAALAVPTVAVSQIQIDRSRPAKPQGEIHVENAFGSLRVVGWDKPEVAVSGSLAAGAEELGFDGEESTTWIDVAVPEAWFYESDDDTEYRTDLVLHVPRGSSLEARTTNASIEVEGVEGELSLETVNGPIAVRSGSRKIEIDTMTGTVDVAARGAVIEVESISGAVKLRGATRAVAVETVSGAVDVEGEQLREARIESTTGAVRLAASFVETGEVEIETFDGPVELWLPAEVKAHFECVTFSGKIENAFGTKPRREGRFTPHSKLEFSTGLNEFEVSVETYSGDIVLRKQGAAK